MSYAGQPGTELACAGIIALLQGYYCLYECFLENVIGQVTVAYNKVDVRVQLILITCQEGIERLIVSV